MPVCERLQGWGKTATTRAHDSNFVDHEGGQRQRMRAGDRTLQDQCATWTYALHGEGEPCRGAGGFHDDVSEARAPVAQQRRRHTELAQQRQLMWVFPHDTYLGPSTLQHLSTESPEFTVAQHHDVIGRLHTYLFQDFKGGCQRLGEYGRFVGDTGRYRVEIGDRHPHILSETAIGVENAHDLSRWAVAAQPLGADCTMPTGK